MTGASEPSLTLDMGRAREVFEASTDFTIGLEEEFAILDPATLELEHAFVDLFTGRARKTTSSPSRRPAS